MRNSVYRLQSVVLTSILVAEVSVASGKAFPALFAEQPPALAVQKNGERPVCPQFLSKEREGRGTRSRGRACQIQKPGPRAP